MYYFHVTPDRSDYLKLYPNQLRILSSAYRRKKYPRVRNFLSLAKEVFIDSGMISAWTKKDVWWQDQQPCAFAEGKKDLALSIMRKAADLEDSVDKHPVTPGAVLPARELLGDMLVMLEGHAEAVEAYEASLQISPNRFNSLYGAGRAAELAGDSDKAKSYYAKLMEFTAEGDSNRPGIEQAQTFLATN